MERDSITKSMMDAMENQLPELIPFGPIHASPLDLQREILRELTEIKQATTRIATTLELSQLPPLRDYLDRLRKEPK